MKLLNDVDVFDNEWIDYDVIDDSDADVDVEYAPVEDEAETLITYYFQKYGSERFAK